MQTPLAPSAYSSRLILVYKKGRRLPPGPPPRYWSKDQERQRLGSKDEEMVADITLSSLALADNELF